MFAACLLLTTAFAASDGDDVAQESVATRAPTPDDHPLLRAARGLAASGERDAAAELLRYVTRDTTLGQDVRDLAQDMLARLEDQNHDTVTTMRLAGWQALGGAVLLGPVTLSQLDTYVAPGTFLGATTAGALVGGGLGVWYGNRFQPSPEQVTAIIAAQQLGVAHGIAAGLAATEGDRVHAGAVWGGAVVGSTAGYLLARQELDAGVVAATYSGTAWGTAISLILLGTNDAFTGEGDDAVKVVAAADVVGAGFGVAAHGLGATRGQVRGMNFGGIAGGAFLLGFAAATQDTIVWTPPAVGAAVIAGGLAGGAAGVALARNLEGRDPLGDDLAGGVLPIVALVPTDDGLSAHVQTRFDF